MHRLSLSVRLVPPCTVPASPSPEVDNGEILWVQAFSHIDVSSEACPFFFLPPDSGAHPVEFIRLACFPPTALLLT